MEDNELDAYRVRVTVKNNLLLSAVESAGYIGHGSQARFCRDAGIRPSAFGRLVSMKDPPLNMNGEFSVTAKSVMEILGAAPSDLWTTAQLNAGLETNHGEVSVSESELRSMLNWGREPELPEDVVDRKLVTKTVAAVVGTLTQREGEVLALRFGLGGAEEKTQEEVGHIYGVGRSRIDQIEKKAMRKLKNPSRARMLSHIEHSPHFSVEKDS